MNNIIVREFVSTVLSNTNGKLEGQRLNEKWLFKNSYFEELDFFQKNNILNSQALYVFLNGDSSKCSCGADKRFVGFRDGFKKYCMTCSKTTHNHMKSIGNVEVSLIDLPESVKDKTGGYSTSKIKKLSVSTINNIIQRTNYLKDNASLSERIYNIEKGIVSPVLCDKCNKPNDNFYSSLVGYKPTCKGECSKLTDFTPQRNGSKKHFFKQYSNFYQNEAFDEYKVQMFSEYDYLNDNDCVVKFEHKTCGHRYIRDVKYQGHLKCPKCFPVRSKVQYEVFEFLDSISNEFKFNDRKLIAPKEIDILGSSMAVEYDGQMFHSFGKSSFGPLNNLIENKNIHLEKTEILESLNVQLFRIFSSEWINKENIWKSILNSKLGNTTRIFARKCIIKEVSNKDARTFINENHLQGHVNSSTKLGLFYNEELVSMMTFGKTRRSKWKSDRNFELLRFCSKLNLTIVGGASKLIKFFENKYNPELLLSYANRRWSQGNLYEKIGFEFVENTVPNYFYFSGDDSSTLLSREQFQKHKLKSKLEIFDPNLTETENMFNNNYRKIYDCGSKVYVRKYK